MTDRMPVLLQVESLSVTAGDEVLVQDLSLILRKGERLTILGETGAGKSLLVQAIMGLLPKGLEQQGRILLDGHDTATLSREALEAMWGRRISMLPQEPWHSLDPLMRSEEQVSEVYECVLGQSRTRAKASARRDLAGVALQGAGHKLPGQLSGGMAQRLAFCAATAAGAELILADEPTKGLDASKRDAIALLLRNHADKGAVLTITHDVAVAEQIGGQLLVMREGQLVEQGVCTEVLRRAKADYTRELIAAAPRHWPAPEKNVEPPGRDAGVVLTARNLSQSRGGKSLFSGLDLQVRRGEIIGVTGDSGCGKSSLGDTLLGLLPPASGWIQRSGEARHRYLKLYQDPPAAFAPGVRLQQLFDDLIALHRLDASRLPALLLQLRLSPTLLQRPAADVSGGELQRLAIARALMLDPVFLFADEPVSRLDPITAREIIFLLRDVARRFHCAVLLVSHDPDVVERICQRRLHFHHQGRLSAA